MSRDTIIRDTAYAIWEAEGRPEGRSQQHWLMAERQVARTTADGTAAKAKPDDPKPVKAASGGAGRHAPTKKTAGKARTPKAPGSKTH